MPMNKPCLHCGATLLPNGDCASDGCPFNPAFDNVEFDSEVEVESGGGDTPVDINIEHLKDELAEREGEAPDAPDDLNDLSDERYDAPDEQYDDERKGEEKVDSPDELSDEGQGETPDPERDAQKELDERLEEESAESQQKTPEDPPQENEDGSPEKEEAPEQKLSEDGDQEPEDDAHDDLERDRNQDEEFQTDSEAEGQPEMPDPDDDDLPPRPRGCNGDCKPGDQYDEDAVPCPHCTAKSFKEQMKQEQKEKDQGEMQQDWQNFLDNWENQNEEKRKQDLDDFLDGIGDDEGEKDLPDEKHEQKPDGITCEECGSFIADAVDQGTPGPEHVNSCSLYMPDEPKGEEDVPEEDDTPPEEEMQDGEEEPKDEPEDEQEVPEEEEAPEDEESDEFKRLAQKMTVGQEKRFDNIVKRLTPKVENTFGKTNEDFHKGAKGKGQFDGEELSQTIQIQSRGVTYFVTISAMKSE